MKKITLFMAAMAVSFASVFAQEVVLTQTPGPLNGTGVSCPGGDGAYYRNYDLANETLPFSSVSVTGVEFVVGTIDSDEELIVNVYEFFGFPLGFDSTALPPALATQTITVGTADVGLVTRVTFDTPGVTNENGQIVIQVIQPTISGNQLFFGVTDVETESTYLSSDNCGITGEPQTVDEVGFPDAHHIFNLVVEENILSVDDNTLTNVSLFPNPSTGGTVTISSKIAGDMDVTVFDILGKQVINTTTAGDINVSSLKAGVYMVQVSQEGATATKKLVVR